MNISRCWTVLALISITNSLSAQKFFDTNNHQQPPREEFRGLWVATVYNLDWPSQPGLSADQQREEFRNIVRVAADTGFNAIILQVRPTADALYRSSREPWSEYLSGRQGVNPGYDPLAFAIREAHAAGLQLHAWFNPFRARVSSSGPPNEQHVTQRRPEWVRRYGGLSWMDPGIPAVRDWVIESIVEVVRNYDVDGIHLDDYFYPYPLKNRGKTTPFPDTETWRIHGRGTQREEWRRLNVNDFIMRLKPAVQRVKPWVKVGISPFGIWRPGVPAQIEAGLDAYVDLSADSRRWLREGWLDYFSPQLYWPRGGAQDYDTLLRWWSSENVRRKHLWPGLAIDRIGRDRNAAHIAEQISTTTHLPTSSGHLLWHWTPLRQNKGGIRETLRNGPYRNFATVPPTPWLSKGERPERPKIRARHLAQGVEVTIQPSSRTSVRWFVIIRDGRARLVRHYQDTTQIILPEANHITIIPLGLSGVTGPPASLQSR